MKDEYCCEYMFVHDEIVKKVKNSLPDDDTLYGVCELYKLFGDVTRIRILYALFQSEMCVRDIATLLNMTTSAISHQLKLLKQARLVKFRRDGKTLFYSLADDHVRKIIDNGIEHINER